MTWYIIFAVLFIVPLWQLVPRYRLPQWAALIALVPFRWLSLRAAHQGSTS